MIAINRMMGIILILIFVVPLAMFGYSMVSSAEAAAGGNMEISQQEQMTQLIFYTASISYQCTDEIGGFEKGVWADVGGTYWTDWEDYRESGTIDWEGGLGEAGSDLECYGATSTLPMAEGFLAEALPNYQGWLNDQTGEYSRQGFVITEEGDGEIEIGPCIVHDDDPASAVFLFATPDEDAVTTYREGSWTSYSGEPTYDFSGGLNPTTDCHTLTGTTYSQSDGGPVITTIVMGEELPSLGDSGTDSVSGVAGWDDFSSGFLDEDGPTNYEAPQYTLCEGTTGYVQSNPGPNDEETDDGPDYSPNNPPGDPSHTSTEGLTGGDEEANIIHPYIVITNWEDDCHD